jgi:hypothetical protein
MNQDRFWLTDEQFSKIVPHLSTDTRGKERVDDRRVISGICARPEIAAGAGSTRRLVMGLWKTLYNRYVRWAAKGVRVTLFQGAGPGRWSARQVMIGSSAVKAHRSAAGGKGGEKSSDRSFARRAHHENPRANRHSLPPARFRAHQRARRRLHCRRAASRTPARL